MPPMIRHLGDRGLLVELGHGIDPAVNRRVKQLHRIIARERPHGVVETVPAYASLLVVFDPLQASPEALKRLIAGLCDFEDAGPAEDRTVVEIPVVYGGEAGPDLDADQDGGVASLSGLQGCCVLEAVGGHDPIVVVRRGRHDRGILDARPQIVIRRVGVENRKHLRIFAAAVV